MWALTAVSRLAMCACLAMSVFPGRLIHLPRLASRVTLAVRADARDVIYLSTSLDVMSILVSILLFYTVIEHCVMVSARGCPGSTCISPVWLERCKLSLSLSTLHSLSSQTYMSGSYPLISQAGWTRCNLIPFRGGMGGGHCNILLGLKLYKSFLFALQWTIVTMLSTTVTIHHHLISQAGWNRCNLSICSSALLSS